MIKEVMALVGERQTLREWRQANGLTQTDLGKMLGISYQTVSRIERGELQPSALVQEALARVAGAKTLRFPKRTADDLEWLRNVDQDAPYKPLKWWRQTRAMSLSDLSAASGISTRGITRIEAGVAMQLRPHNRRALAKALNIPPDRIVMPGDANAVDAFNGPSSQDLMRADLRGKNRVLRRAYDALRDGSNCTHKFQDSRGYVDLLADIERELRGT